MSTNNYTPPFWGEGFSTNSFNAANLIWGTFLGRFRNKNKRAQAWRLNEIDDEIEKSQAYRLFCTRFKWGGEPLKPYPYGYIESLLYSNGFCVAFKDENDELAILPATISKVNRYYIPLEYLVTAATADGGQTKWRLPAEECVAIRDNSIWQPMAPTLQRRAGVIADTGRGIQTYILGMKQSSILFADDNTKTSFEEAMAEKLDNSPYIIVGRKLTRDMEKVPENLLNAGYNSGDLNGLLQSKMALRAEMLNAIGIEATAQQKSQYVSEGERESDMSSAQLYLEDSINLRNCAVEEIKEKLGFDVTCECIMSIKTEADALEETAEESDRSLEDVSV